MKHAERIVDLAKSIYMAEIAGTDKETVAAAAMAIRDAKTFYASVEADEDLKGFDDPDYYCDPPLVSRSELDIGGNYDEPQFKKGS